MFTVILLAIVAGLVTLMYVVEGIKRLHREWPKVRRLLLWHLRFLWPTAWVNHCIAGICGGPTCHTAIEPQGDRWTCQGCGASTVVPHERTP